MNTIVRAIRRDDAKSVVRMWSEFARYLRELGDTDDQKLGTENFLRDGFGDDPAFLGFIAEQESRPVGYLLYHFGHDVDQATRIVHIVDLWVDPAARRAGVARRLMTAAAERGQAKGATQMIWSVFKPNELAAEFYKSLGARFLDQLKFMHLPVSALASRR